MPWKKKWCRLERRLAWILYEREQLSLAEITNHVNDNFGRDRTMVAIKSQLYLLRERRENYRGDFLREIGLPRWDEMSRTEQAEAIGITKIGRRWKIQTERENRRDYAL